MRRWRTFPELSLALRLLLSSQVTVSRGFISLKRSGDETGTTAAQR